MATLLVVLQLMAVLINCGLRDHNAALQHAWKVRTWKRNWAALQIQRVWRGHAGWVRTIAVWALDCSDQRCLSMRMFAAGARRCG